MDLYQRPCCLYWMVRGVLEGCWGVVVGTCVDIPASDGDNPSEGACIIQESRISLRFEDAGPTLPTTFGGLSGWALPARATRTLKRYHSSEQNGNKNCSADCLERKVCCGASLALGPEHSRRRAPAALAEPAL